MFLARIIASAKSEPLHLRPGGGKSRAQLGRFRVRHVLEAEIGGELVRLVERSRQLGKPARPLGGSEVLWTVTQRVLGSSSPVL